MKFRKILQKRHGYSKKSLVSLEATDFHHVAQLRIGSSNVMEFAPMLVPGLNLSQKYFIV